MTEALQLIAASPGPLALACFMAFLASVLGGLSGFGTGLVLPVFLVPLVGIGSVIPVMAVAMLFNNFGRILAFRRDIQWDHVTRILAPGVPACAAGAYAYTFLSAKWIAILLATLLIISVVVRRLLHPSRHHLSPGMEAGVGAGFGFINGGMTGAGVFLISVLMSSGLSGAALIATDAVISVVLGFVKIAVFGGTAALTLHFGLIGLLLGLCTTPGAFVARWLLKHIPSKVHAWIMESVVVIGALLLLLKAI